MRYSKPIDSGFNATSTANYVRIDLTGKVAIVTSDNAGMGLETCSRKRY
jgi:hypothetical protein